MGMGKKRNKQKKNYRIKYEVKEIGGLIFKWFSSSQVFHIKKISNNEVSLIRN